MKKIDLWLSSHLVLKKLIMELKIVVLIVLTTVSNALAISTYSQVAKVSLDMKDVSLEQVLDEIEKQSEFYFIFNQKQIDVTRSVNIKVDKELISDILPELFQGTPVNYVILDRKILLSTDSLVESFPVPEAKTETQQKQVSGKVVDSKGDPLVGVNVVIKGTTIGVTTDIDGKYSIDVPDQNGVLVFSFI